MKTNISRFIFAILICLFVSNASSGVIMKTVIGERSLLINNKPMAGTWDFDYSIKTQIVKERAEGEWPIMCYLTSVITGNIIVSKEVSVLERVMKSGAAFAIEYMDEKNNNIENIIFNGCKIVCVCKKKDKKGNVNFVYSFQADSATRK